MTVGPGVLLVAPQAISLRTNYSQFLEEGWVLSTYLETEKLLQDPSFEVIVVVDPDLGKSRFNGLCDLLSQRHQGGWNKRLVLCTTPDIRNIRRIAGLPPIRLVLLGVDHPQDMRRAVEECWEESLAGIILRLFLSRASVPPVVAGALKRVIVQPLPSPEDAVEALSRGEPGFLRTVKHLSQRLGCRPSYLSRKLGKEGFQISDFLRWNTFLRGIALRQTRSLPWSQIAVMLGFPSPAAWTNFTQRLVGIPPSEAEAAGLNYWLEQCGTRMGFEAPEGSFPDESPNRGVNGR
jgi:AraC-like DNA-binding protein